MHIVISESHSNTKKLHIYTNTLVATKLFNFLVLCPSSMIIIKFYVIYADTRIFI